MRRALPLLLGAAGMLAAGCQKNQAPAPALDNAYAPADTTYAASDRTTDDAPLDSLDSVGQPSGTVERDTTTDTYGASTARNDEVLEPAVSDHIYVVQKGDTLYSLARRFYNDERRWRDIWEANRARLPDQNKLPVGMKLIIP